MRDRGRDRVSNLSVIESLSRVLWTDLGWQHDCCLALEASAIELRGEVNGDAKKLIQQCISEWSMRPLMQYDYDSLSMIDVWGLVSRMCMGEPYCTMLGDNNKARAGVAAAMMLLFLLEAGKGNVADHDLRGLFGAAAGHFNGLTPQEQWIIQAILWELGTGGPDRQARGIVGRAILDFYRRPGCVAASSWRSWVR